MPLKAKVSPGKKMSHVVSCSQSAEICRAPGGPFGRQNMLPEIWFYSTFGSRSKTAETVEENVDLRACCVEGSVLDSRVRGRSK